MKGKDEIQNLFSDKLGGFEAKVNPELWGNIASQIGAGTSAAATGMALTTKIIIGFSAASVVAVASFVALTSSEKEEPNKKIAQTVVVEETKPIREVDKTIIADSIVENTIVVESIEEPIVEPFLLEPPVVGPVLAPTLEPIVAPEQRVLMQADSVHNVFKTQEKVVSTEVSKAIVEADPVLKSTPQEELITEESTQIKVFFPNVFTPNSDGTNDLLFISNPEELDRDGFVLQIVDQSYKTVFTSTDPYFEWNGNDLGGEPAKNGHYIAIITSKDKNGNEAKPVMYQFEIRK